MNLDGIRAVNAREAHYLNAEARQALKLAGFEQMQPAIPDINQQTNRITALRMVVHVPGEAMSQENEDVANAIVRRIQSYGITISVLLVDEFR